MPSSTSFFALSHAPPELARKTAINVPAAIAPPREPASGPGRRPKPTAVRGRAPAGGAQPPRGGPGADVDDASVLRPLCAIHDPGVGAELVAHLVHDRAG